MGDWVASAIKALARSLHVTRWLRETSGCGCKKRQERLNRFGRWVVKPFRRAWKALLPAPPGE